MKKLYILILLCLFVFVPQITKADVIPEYYPKQIHEMQNDNAENVLCFLEKKSKLTNEYTGQNLKMQQIPCTSIDNDTVEYYDSLKEGFLSYVNVKFDVFHLKYLTDIHIETKDLCDIIPNCEKLLAEESNYYVILPGPKNLPKKYVIKSFTCHYRHPNCKDYIGVYTDPRPWARTPYGYDVTDVPPGSYLKFIPETKELQVIPPSDDSYEKIIEDEKDKIEHNYYKYNEEKQIPEVFPLNKETYKEFVKTEQEKVQNKEIRKELERLKKRLKREILKDKSRDFLYKVKYGTTERYKISEINKQILKVSQQEIRDSFPKPVIRGMLIALILTLIIECLIALPFGLKFIGLVFLVNLITNPALNCIIWHYNITNTEMIFLLEAHVVLIEWGIFSIFVKKKYLKLFLFSLCANMVSYLVGYLLNIL